MKIYAIIISVIAVLLLGAAGYFGYQYFNLNGKVTSLEQERNNAQGEIGKAKKDLEDTKSSFTNVEKTAIAYKAAINSFTPPGDVKVGTFDAAKATEARQKIGDITDAKDKDRAEKAWDTFHTNSQLNDYQFLLNVFSESLERSIQNAQSR